MRGLKTFAAAALTGLVALTGAAEAKDTLRLMTVFDAPTVKLWEPVLAAYNEANPNVEVKMETVAGSGAAVYPDVLRTSMASGDPPDVFFMWGGEIAGPSSRPARSRLLDSYYEKYGWDKVVAPWTIERITPRRPQIRRPLPCPRHGPLVSGRPVREIRPLRAEDLCRSRDDLLDLQEGRHLLRVVRRQVRLADHAPARLFHRVDLRPGRA